ncbi:FkbM family methyltransferase [Kiloniella sp.]|uniref:FkbM family methyltransferase n=1 Tax=Kiloniella sp. TaxID=1938587 RepID=UPI003A909793
MESRTWKDRLKPIARWVVNSRLYGYWSDSQGDWRYLYMPFTWWLAKVLVPRRTVKIGSSRLNLPCDNSITHFRWYLYNKKEQEVSKYIDKYVKEGDTLFDIGANIGVFTLYTAISKNNVNIYSFEPEYSNLHYLKENIIANKLTEKVNLFSVAVSDKDQLSSLHIQDVTPGAAVHTESVNDISTTDEGYKVVWKEGIATSTVDSLSKHIGVVPNCMKIDTDGNEPKILRGAKKTLTDPQLRSIVIEMPMDETANQVCIDLLTDAGMKVVWSAEYTRNQVWEKYTV